MPDLCQQAFAFFRAKAKLASFTPLGDGRINSTWLVTTAAQENYVLQRLNPAVFPEPALVQQNLCRVTEHLRKGGCNSFEVLRSPAGKTAWQDRSGGWWRLLTYLEGTGTLASISSPAQAQEIGAALGRFHTLLADLPPPPLADTLPGFHNTIEYLAAYDTLMPNVCQPQAADCRAFIEERRTDMRLLEEARQQGAITEQTVHGDPKVGNFLFSLDGQRVVSLIDLDTVKPGLLLHDLGDCLRSCCNPCGEDVQHPEKIFFDCNLFAAVLTGYLSQAAELLANEDQRLLVASVRLISLELGLRFYSDYLAGSRYFKADHPEQNLFRARVQFALVRSMENQYSSLMRIAADCGLAPHSSNQQEKEKR
ncbi:Phosphotransferase enzyme family protein [Candidatus Electronema halotolerans]